MDYENDIAPHKKSRSKSPLRKSNHKHDFKPCVFEYEGTHWDEIRGRVPKQESVMGAYCSVCGKINHTDYDWRIWVPVAPGASVGYSEYTKEARRELDPETRTVPTFHIKDIFRQKFVEPKEDEL